MGELGTGTSSLPASCSETSKLQGHSARQLSPAELSSSGPVCAQLVGVIYSPPESRVKYVWQKAGQKPTARQRVGSEVILKNVTRECCRTGAGGFGVIYPRAAAGQEAARRSCAAARSILLGKPPECLGVSLHTQARAHMPSGRRFPAQFHSLALTIEGSCHSSGVQLFFFHLGMKGALVPLAACEGHVQRQRWALSFQFRFQ